MLRGPNGARQEGIEAACQQEEERREQTAEAGGRAARARGTQRFCTGKRQPVLEGAVTRPIYCLFYYSGLLGLRPGKLFQAEIIAH